MGSEEFLVWIRGSMVNRKDKGDSHLLGTQTRSQKHKWVMCLVQITSGKTCHSSYKRVLLPPKRISLLNISDTCSIVQIFIEQTLCLRSHAGSEMHYLEQYLFPGLATLNIFCFLIILLEGAIYFRDKQIIQQEKYFFLNRVFCL